MDGINVIIKKHWKPVFRALPFVEILMDGLKSPYVHRNFLVETLDLLEQVYSADTQCQQVLEYFRMRWIDVLESMMIYSIDDDTMTIFLDLFPKLFTSYQDEFVKGAAKSYGVSAETAARLFEVLMSQASLTEKLQEISEGTQVIYKSRKRKRKESVSCE